MGTRRLERFEEIIHFKYKFEEIIHFKSKFGGQTGTQGLIFGRKTNLRNSSLKENSQLVAGRCKEVSETRLNHLHDLARSAQMG